MLFSIKLYIYIYILRINKIIYVVGYWPKWYVTWELLNYIIRIHLVIVILIKLYLL